MAKISDVAALAGVSPSAVSRVLSSDPTMRITESARQRVLDAARSLNYVPNHAARSLRTSRASAIALVVPDVTSAIFGELARGVEEAAAKRGLSMVLAYSAEITADGTWVQRMISEGRVDGVLLQAPDGATVETMTAVVPGQMPVVLINGLDKGTANTVVMDDAEATAVAVRHLHSLGHQEIGYLGGVLNSATGQRRLAGYAAEIQRLGILNNSDHQTCFGYTSDEGRQAVRELLSRGPLPSALVVANVNAAMGALAEIHASQLRVPDDVSIVAVHDVWYADSIWPPLTTVRMPLRELGRTAVDVLNTHRSAGSKAQHFRVSDPQPQLIQRQSTAPPRIET